MLAVFDGVCDLVLDAVLEGVWVKVLDAVFDGVCDLVLDAVLEGV